MSYSVDDKIVINSDPLSIDETIALLMPSSSKIAITMYAGTWEENIHIQNIPRTLLAKLENDLYYICQELRIQWPDILKIALLLRYGLLKPADINIVVAITGLSEVESALVNALRDVKSKINYYFKQDLKDSQASDSIVPEISFSVNLDSDLIQVKADNHELDRRISRFECHKRANVDDANILEFIVGGESEDCARTSAPLRRRTNENPGHLLVRRVYNESGPHHQHYYKIPPQSVVGINQRVNSVEKSLGIPPPPLSPEIYARLKKIEDRLLALEAISPEYFSDHLLANLSFEKSNRIPQKKTYSVADIAKKIKHLEKMLAENYK